MFRFIFAIFVSATLFSVDVVDREKARQFESLATNSLGVLPQLSPEIRSRRTGPVLQKVSISSDGVLTITQEFYCKSAGDGKKTKGKCEKRFFLADLAAEGSRKRYDLNHHMNTITFTDYQGQWTLAFRSPIEMEKAAGVLKGLISRAPEREVSSQTPSSIAKAAGFRYVVLAPRAESVALGVRQFTFKEQSSCLEAWLTKHDPDETVAILKESRNALPLYFYDIEAIDTVPFFCTATLGATSFSPCTLGEETEQSAVSDDAEALSLFLAQRCCVGIRFDTMPDLTSPIAIMCRFEDKHRIHKCAKAENFNTRATQWFTKKPLLYRNYIPYGSVFSWFTAIHENSFDVLRYCLLEERITPSLLSETLYREFPQLEVLLNTKSRYRPDLSLAETICLTSQALATYGKDLSPLCQSVLRLALFSNELGASFGTAEEIPYNSWPFALQLGEKAGLREYQKRALFALISSPFPEEKPAKKASPTSFDMFFHESKVASEIGMPLGEWLRLKECYWKVLASLKTGSKFLKEALHSVESLQKQYRIYASIGIPRGTYVCHGPLPVRGLYSSYLWETRDPSHRDGLSLKRRRERYESMLVENPRSSWKGRFWDWLQRDSLDIYPNRYLTDAERLQYKAKFSEGNLMNPALPKSDSEIELMYVIDEDANVYLGVKKEAESQEGLGLNHASFMCGRPVSSAGKITFLHGVPIALNNRSGHYRSTINEVAVALVVLKEHGVNIDALAIYLDYEGKKGEIPSGKVFLETYGVSLKKQ